MSKFKIIVNIITLIAFVVLIYLSRNQIQETLTQLPDIAWWFLLLQIPVQLISYLMIAHLYYSYFQSIASVGQLKIKEMYKIALELQFVNNIFPSGGMSGFSYLSLRLRPLGINFATSTLAQSLRFVLSFISYLPILGIGLLLLALGGQANDSVMLLGGSLFSMIIIGTLLFIYLIGSKTRINEFVDWLPKAINRVVQALPSRSDKEFISLSKVERALNEIHIGYMRIYKDLPAIKKPFFYALVNNLFQLFTLYLVFLAFGVAVNPGAIVLAYAVANFAGLIAITPGGVGVYEFLMTSVLSTSGVDPYIALQATLAFRMSNLLIFVPIGYIMYHYAINRRQVQASSVKSTNDDVLASLASDRDKKKSKPSRRKLPRHKKGKS